MRPLHRRAVSSRTKSIEFSSTNEHFQRGVALSEATNSKTCPSMFNACAHIKLGNAMNALLARWLFNFCSPPRSDAVRYAQFAYRRAHFCIVVASRWSSAAPFQASRTTYYTLHRAVPFRMAHWRAYVLRYPYLPRRAEHIKMPNKEIFHSKCIPNCFLHRSRYLFSDCSFNR